jgi:hypothetical protein
MVFSKVNYTLHATCVAHLLENECVLTCKQSMSTELTTNANHDNKLFLSFPI